MTVILVLFTFAVFLLVDYLLHPEAAVQPAVERQSELAPQLQPRFIEGFYTPEKLRYHAGHSWLLEERRHLARVGIDEFAAKLAGAIDKIELPKPGQWIRQGQRAWSLFRGDERSEMVSPTEGEVIEVNPDVVEHPELLRQDPYGRGWLMTVHVPDDDSTSRNLIPRRLVPNWMRDAVQSLYAQQPQLAGAVAAEGGRPVDDIAAALPAVSWKQLTSEHFLPK